MGIKLALPTRMKLHPSLLASCLLFGCPVDPPEAETSIEISAALSLPAPSSQVSVTSAFFSFTELELVSDVDIEGQEVKVEQIVSSQGVVGFSLLDAPPALYSRLQIKLNKPTPDVLLPPEFQGERLSLLIEGTAQIAEEQSVTFRIQDDKLLKKLNIVLSQGLDLLPGGTAQIAILGNIDELFEGVSFESIQETDLTEGIFLLKLSDEPFLNEHPNAEEVATQLTENLEGVFNTTN